jgi:hypothetical protein
MINPTAMATIRLLIDCLITDPDSFRRFWVSVMEMAALPPGLADFAEIPSMTETVPIIGYCGLGRRP